MISLGAGENLVSEYFSTIYYHSEQPKWGEAVKVRWAKFLSGEQLEKYNITFSIYLYFFYD